MFYYHASWASSKLKLKSQFVEYLSVGLMTVLIDMPYDINGAKYVHWIWHDTDPNICMYLTYTDKILGRFSLFDYSLLTYISLLSFEQMIAIIGCHGIHTIFIYVFRRVFNFGFILSENGLKSGKTLRNGNLDHCN